MNEAIREPAHWDVQYRAGGLPWDTGRPSSELRRVLARHRVRPCRAIELGCGTGTNAVWLAGRHFDVTGVDLSGAALGRARGRAAAAGLRVRFLRADLCDPGVELGGPFDFFFDRGCYHAARLADGPGYLRTLARITRPGTLGLVLLGNAAEPEDEAGPPVVEEAQVRAEWGRRFEILRLRPFRFDPRRPGEKRYLGWSCLVRRRGWAGPAWDGPDAGGGRPRWAGAALLSDCRPAATIGTGSTRPAPSCHGRESTPPPDRA